MKTKKIFTICGLASLLSTTCFSQNITEKIQELSKNASKGYFYDAVQNAQNGNYEITYKYKKKSKDADATYETYYFDKNLTFLKNEETKVNVQDKSPYTKTFVYASVGGCTSFNVLSTKLNLTKQTYNYTWNSDKKRFIGKRTESIDIKPKNDDKRAYSGYAAFREMETGKMMVLTSSETKGEDNKVRKDFILLEVKTDLSTKEIELPLEPSQLVYCDIAKSNSTGTNSDDDDELTLDNGDMIFIFAPTFVKKSATDYKKYTYLRIDKNGAIKENLKLDAPSANLIITGLGEANDGSIYLCGSYSKDDKTFDQLYKEYSPLENPCFSGGANSRMATYEGKTEKVKMNFFTLIKVKDGKIEWIKNTSIEDLAKLVKTPPKQKKAPSYTGKRFLIEYFNVMSNGDIFISGQLLSRVKIGDNLIKAYKEVVCLQISNTGAVKAQYGIKPESISDKKSCIYQIPQNFISTEPSSLYWNLMEVKAIKGYASFYDAYNGSPTYYPNFYPSMVKINTATSEIEDYKIIGNRKFLLNKTVPFIYNKTDKSITYIGSDKKKKLWLAKYVMN